MTYSLIDTVNMFYHAWKGVASVWDEWKWLFHRTKSGPIMISMTTYLNATQVDAHYVGHKDIRDDFPGRTGLWSKLQWKEM